MSQNNIDKINNLMKQIASLELKKNKSVKKYEQKILKLIEDQTKEVEVFDKELDTLKSEVRSIASANKESLFSDSKSLSTSYGKIRFRLVEKVNIIDSEKAIEILNNLGLKEALSIQYKVNKTEIKKDKYKTYWKELGVNINREDNFYIDIDFK